MSINSAARRARLHSVRIAATAVAALAATVVLSACGSDDDGVKKSRGQASTTVTPEADAPQGAGGTEADAASTGKTGGTGGTGGGAHKPGSGATDVTGGSGTQGKNGGTGTGTGTGTEKSGGTGAEKNGGSDTAKNGGTGGGTEKGAITPCTNAGTSLGVAPAKRPVNYQLITLTNTGSRSCTVIGYPVVTFGPDLDGSADKRRDTHPQAVVTLKPGESAYAGLNTSPADQQDDGKRPHATSISVDLMKEDGATYVGQPRRSPVSDLFVSDPTVTAWQQDVADALL
ncbi:DUF4232 domain-containing protein [Streptomyces sp. SAJ15]|uniref:DUF4232 domain-containing protein n=1 Tax=Streptomyces sp. SAJ15 TaxID=2011095 RepID=UPI0011865F92|nr:DUF4232 domain-containing protein [Streptomyces sp. SAJ15]TVL92460.1 hypothetical protein CD790_12315 [Streptomyces sp. SAJ15]